MDYKWMSRGGCLLDGDGDLCLSNPLESMQDMTRSRLKAALDGWKLYRIGAGLDDLRGNTVDAELELKIKRQIEASLTQDFLPSGSFTVVTIPSGPEISAFVFIQNTLLATAKVTL